MDRVEQSLEISQSPNELRRRYWAVTVYFVLVGPLTVCALHLAVKFGNALAGMSPTGSIGRDPYLLWAASIYCCIGAAAGLIARPRTRVFLACLAQLIVVISEMLSSTEMIGGALIGGSLCIYLAVPFGLAWFILIADKIFGEGATTSIQQKQ